MKMGQLAGPKYLNSATDKRGAEGSVRDLNAA